MNKQHAGTPSENHEESPLHTPVSPRSRSPQHRPRRKPDSTGIRTRHDDKKVSDSELERAFLQVMDKPDPVQLTEVSKLLKEVFAARLKEDDFDLPALLKPDTATIDTSVQRHASGALEQTTPPQSKIPTGKVAESTPQPAAGPIPITTAPIVSVNEDAMPRSSSMPVVRHTRTRKTGALAPDSPPPLNAPAPPPAVPAPGKKSAPPASIPIPEPPPATAVAVEKKPTHANPVPILPAAVKPANRPLRILMIATELAPYVKSGGLADMVASLSAQLKSMGHDVRVIIPKYSIIDTAKNPLAQCHGPMGVWMGNNTQQWCLVLKGTGDGGVPVYLIEYKDYYERWGIYHAANMDDYRDNPARFGFLCRAALQFCMDTGWAPDVVHAHDWHAAMAPAYIKTWHWNDPVVGPAASVLTIHNISYQGKYPRSFQPYLAIAPGHFTPARFEDGGQINLLKGGLSFSDMVTTVSPTHRNEICTPQGGFGLAPFLSAMGNRLIGILNGIDYQSWSPLTDPLIPAPFSDSDLSGKLLCKRRMQETFGLAIDDHIAVIGAIGRFVDQKGFHLIKAIIADVLKNMHAQFVILGSGKKDLEVFFGTLPDRFPGRAGAYIGFNNEHAHLIEAGSDFFLMPSLYEPCGLNQMYSQRYGTLPVVRATGGLADTVDNYNQSAATGTGFTFLDPTPKALYNTLGWVMETYYDRPRHLEMLRRNAMQRDFSWNSSASRYVDVYRQAMANKKSYDQSFAKR